MGRPASRPGAGVAGREPGTFGRLERAGLVINAFNWFEVDVERNAAPFLEGVAAEAWHVSSIELTGAVDEGVVWTLSLDDATVTYSPEARDDLTDVAAGLAAGVNQNVSSVFRAYATGAGIVVASSTPFSLETGSK